MNTVEFPFPRERVVCFFCQCSLMEKNQFHGLNLETSAGVMVLCCNDHRDAGYDFIGKLNTWKASITTPIQN